MSTSQFWSRGMKTAGNDCVNFNRCNKDLQSSIRVNGDDFNFSQNSKGMFMKGPFAPFFSGLILG